MTVYLHSDKMKQNLFCLPIVIYPSPSPGNGQNATWCVTIAKETGTRINSEVYNSTMVISFSLT